MADPSSRADDQPADSTRPTEYVGPSVERRLRAAARAYRRIVAAHPSAVALAAVLLVAAVARSYVYGSVFRDGHVVLLANDPFYYRFAVERHVAAAASTGDLLSYAGRDPLLVVGLAAVTAALGGPDAAGAVVAWYPVVVGLLTVSLVFVLAARVTESRAVGVVAALALALSPVHVARTAVGFGDHHAWDYLLLVAAALCLLALLRADVAGRGGRTGRPSRGRRRRLLAVCGLAFVLAAQALSWVAGFLLVVPAALVVVAVAARDAAAGRRPGRSLLGAVAFLLATGLAGTAHLAFGWTDAALVVVFASLSTLVLFAVSALYVAAAVGVPRWAHVGVGAGATAVAFAALVRLPSVRAVATAGRRYAAGTADGAVVETVSLVGGPNGLVTGPLSLFGLELLLALPAFGWATLAALRDRDAGPLLLATFAWYFLALALIQRRFAGELSPFVAVLAGLTLVRLAVRSGLIDLPAGDEPGWSLPAAVAGAAGALRARIAPASDRPRRLAPVAVALLVVLSAVASSGMIAIKLNQSTVPPAEYEAARALDAYATERGMAAADSYVLSPLGSNRLFNYEVRGDAVTDLSFEYARTTYDPFVAARSPDAQYDRYNDRVGFVVTTDARSPGAPDSTQATLHERLGSRGDGAPGAGHYRLVYASPDRSVAAFALVPGAVVVGRAAPGEAVPVSTSVAAAGRSVSYERRATATERGWYALTVPYAGTYAVDGSPVAVEVPAVADRGVVEATPVRGGGPDADRAHWPLDPGGTVVPLETDGAAVAVDPLGGHHGVVSGAPSTDSGPTDGGLTFTGETVVTVPSPPAYSRASGLNLTARIDGVPTANDSAPARRFPRLVSTAPGGTYAGTRGYQLGLADGHVVGALGDGRRVATVNGPRVDDGRPHRIALRWDGRVLALLVDGEVVDATRYAGDLPPRSTLAIGGTTDGQYRFTGVVDDVRIGPFPPNVTAAGVGPNVTAAGVGSNVTAAGVGSNVTADGGVRSNATATGDESSTDATTALRHADGF